MSSSREFCGVVIYENISNDGGYYLFYSADIDDQLRGYLVLPNCLQLQTGSWYRIEYQDNAYTEELASFSHLPVPSNYILSCSVAEPPSYRDAVFRYIPNSNTDCRNGVCTMIIRTTVRVNPQKSVDGAYVKWYRDSQRILEEIVAPGLEAERINQAFVALEVYAGKDGWHVIRFLGIHDGEPLHNFLPSCFFPLSVNGNYAYSLEDFKRPNEHPVRKLPYREMSSTGELPINSDSSSYMEVRSSSRVGTTIDRSDNVAAIPKILPATVAKWQPKEERAESSQRVETKPTQKRVEAPLRAQSISIMEPPSSTAQQPKELKKKMPTNGASEFPPVFERTPMYSLRSRSSLSRPPLFTNIEASGEREIDITAMIVMVLKKYVIAWTPQPGCNSVLIEMNLIHDSPFEKRTNGLITEGLWLKVKAASRLVKTTDIENQPYITHIATEQPQPAKKNFPPWEQRLIAGKVEILAEFDTTDSNKIHLATLVNLPKVFVMESTSNPHLKVIAPYTRMNEYIDQHTGTSKYKMRFWCTVKQYQPELSSSLYLLGTTSIELIDGQDVIVRPGVISETYCEQNEKNHSAFLFDCVEGRSNPVPTSHVPRHVPFSQVDDSVDSDFNSSRSTADVLNCNVLSTVLEGLHLPRLQNIIGEENLTDEWNEVVSVTNSLNRR